MDTDANQIFENDGGAEGTQVQLVTFEVGAATLAIEISSVQEINRNLDFTVVPQAPAYVRGVTNLRGEVVTILDIHIILGMPPSDANANSRNLIVKHDEEMFGLRVDRVSDIMSVRTCDLTVPPSNLQGVPKQLIQGVYQSTERLVLYVDMDELLKSCNQMEPA